MFHWLFVHAGLDDGGGAWYLWWSGIAADTMYVTGIVVLLRKLNCHTSGCFRIGLHHVEGTPYITCRKHHPTVPTNKRNLTPEHIHGAHAAANKPRRASGDKSTRSASEPRARRTRT